MCSFTTNNASNNKTMITTFEKFLNGTSRRFNKHLTPCKTHVLNLVFIVGMNERGNNKIVLKKEDDEECINALQNSTVKNY